MYCSRPISVCLLLSFHRNAGIGVERSPSDGKDLWRSAVHHGPAMCRGGAVCETVSNICHHLSLRPTETPTPSLTIWWLYTHNHFLPSFLSLLCLLNFTVWLVINKIHWLLSHYKFRIWIQTVTLICCLTLSTHKPWSTMSSLRLVGTRIYWYDCMYVCIHVPYFT